MASHPQMETKKKLKAGVVVVVRERAPPGPQQQQQRPAVTAIDEISNPGHAPRSLRGSVSVPRASGGAENR
jgi:hypothetical protein